MKMSNRNRYFQSSYCSSALGLFDRRKSDNGSLEHMLHRPHTFTRFRVFAHTPFFPDISGDLFRCWDAESLPSLETFLERQVSEAKTKSHCTHTKCSEKFDLGRLRWVQFLASLPERHLAKLRATVTGDNEVTFDLYGSENERFLCVFEGLFQLVAQTFCSQRDCPELQQLRSLRVLVLK